MGNRIRGLSSMATRALLAEAAVLAGPSTGCDVTFEAGGGVEIARRVRAGEAVDLVVLAAGALDALAGEGFVVPDSVTPLFRSDVVAAVAARASVPPLAEERDLRNLIEASPRVGVSTGPSGTAVRELLGRWGFADAAGRQIVEAPPGVPVASLLTSGQADLGFQQYSEFLGATGVTVLGPLPGDLAVTSIFSGAVLASSQRAHAATRVLAVLASETADLAAAHGMSAA